jgi:ATP-binding cassette subfamily A (ABC1) protein 5
MNNTDHDITELMDIISQNNNHIEEYDGDFANLLNIAPHMAVFNIHDYSLPDRLNLTVIYNDTMQHSLPILMNILSNTYYR